MTSRRFPAPWTVEQIPGGYKVLDASGQALAYVYARETKAEADIAKVLNFLNIGAYVLANAKNVVVEWQDGSAALAGPRAS